MITAPIAADQALEEVVAFIRETEPAAHWSEEMTGKVATALLDKHEGDAFLAKKEFVGHLIDHVARVIQGQER